MPECNVKFTTPMIDYVSGREILDATNEELDSIGIDRNPVLSGDKKKDQEYMENQTKLVEENRDNLTKYNLSKILNQLFDTIPMPSNSDFALYADILKQIRVAKKEGIDTISISSEELEKLKKMFLKPPRPEQNRLCAFVIECLDESLVKGLALSAK